jgi:hypothetical protein
VSTYTGCQNTSPGHPNLLACLIEILNDLISSRSSVMLLKRSTLHGRGAARSGDVVDVFRSGLVARSSHAGRDAAALRSWCDKKSELTLDTVPEAMEYEEDVSQEPFESPLIENVAVKVRPRSQGLKRTIQGAAPQQTVHAAESSNKRGMQPSKGATSD